MCYSSQLRRLLTAIYPLEPSNQNTNEHFTHLDPTLLALVTACAALTVSFAPGRLDIHG